MQEFQLVLTSQELQQIVDVLVRQPFREVAPIIVKIQKQAADQSPSGESAT
jgi:hypothetical protein